MIAPTLAGKNVLLTGASRGLGRRIAEEAWRNGASLLLIARDGERLHALRDDLEREKTTASQTIHILCCDLAAPGAAGDIAGRARDVWTRLDGLINNAAMLGPIGRAWETNWPPWEHTLRVNLLTPVELCRFAAPWMLEHGGGSIVNLSGGGAAGSRPGFAAYATAKAGLVRFSEVLADELRGYGVRVNSVAPGAMPTDMLAEILTSRDSAGEKEYAQAQSAWARGGDAAGRAARLCSFLVGAESGEISGKLISAQWDNWEDLSTHSIELENSDIYTLRRIVPRDRGHEWG